MAQTREARGLLIGMQFIFSLGNHNLLEHMYELVYRRVSCENPFNGDQTGLQFGSYMQLHKFCRYRAKIDTAPWHQPFLTRFVQVNPQKLIGKIKISLGKKIGGQPSLAAVKIHWRIAGLYAYLEGIAHTNINRCIVNTYSSAVYPRILHSQQLH